MSTRRTFGPLGDGTRPDSILQQPVPGLNLN